MGSRRPENYPNKEHGITSEPENIATIQPLRTSLMPMDFRQPQKRIVEPAARRFGFPLKLWFQPSRVPRKP